MFERYTETARRVIFFARYEASQFGSPYIETEHLLLGVLREDKALANQLLGSHASAEALRTAITRGSPAAPKTSTTVDLPLSHESKRVLAYGAEECQRLNHKQIEVAHLVLGLLREEKSRAAQLLRERGVTMQSVRGTVDRSQNPLAPGGPAAVAAIHQWIDDLSAEGGRWAVEQRRAGRQTTHFAIYAVEPNEPGEGHDISPAEMLAQTQKRIHFIIGRMENAIANHEFEKARFYSDEERKEREHLRLLCEQFNVEAPPPRAPLLCIAVAGDDAFPALRERCETYISEGAAEVWLLDAVSMRAYTITRADGLREFKGPILQLANPPLEMDLRRVFDQG